MSPESVSHGETGQGLDLWSLGCLVLEMYTGKRPWSHKKYDDLEDLKKCIEKCYAPLIPNDLPCDAKNIIMTCFAFEPDERKDALTLLRHSFLRGDVKNIIEPQLNVKTENPRKIADNINLRKSWRIEDHQENSLDTIWFLLSTVTWQNHLNFFDFSFLVLFEI
ncbi:Mitogen-activated protein kinase kinase kinase 3 [Cardamine amara subsp. amara]|uniref:Mitogen-activated protein kinase kinase kinase 3 n=1 Tax=Cardamine amara subsp. amara TaxID=228776 RepID=A0ABD1ALF4_CARAN